MRAVLPILVVAGLAAAAAPAGAQSFDGRVGIRYDHAASGTPFTGFFDPYPNVVFPMQFLFGAFDAQGFTSRGMFDFIGTATLTDQAGTARFRYRVAGQPGSGLREPYNFGAQFNEQINPAGTVLTFDANRSTGQVTVPWNFGEPAPSEVYRYPPLTAGPPADGGGPNTYFPGERFFIDSGPPVFREMTLTVTGLMQAITGWFVIESQPPQGPGQPGFQTLFPEGFVTDQVQAAFTIVWGTPSPSAAMLLAMGGVAAARRRRA